MIHINENGGGIMTEDPRLSQPGAGPGSPVAPDDAVILTRPCIFCIEKTRGNVQGGA